MIRTTKFLATWNGLKFNCLMIKKYSETRLDNGRWKTIIKAKLFRAFIVSNECKLLCVKMHFPSLKKKVTPFTGINTITHMKLDLKSVLWCVIMFFRRYFTTVQM